jgi:integrase
MGRARATVTRRLSTIAGFYKYAVEEELLDRSPAAHVRRPRVDYESHAVALDRNELGALLVAAGLGAPRDHALIALLALNGLRVSEAAGADIEHLGLERGHRTLTVTRKGGKVVTVPLAPRTARAIDLAIGERAEGPVFLAGDDRRLDRHGAGRIVRATARRAGIGKIVTPHTLRHAFITAAQGRGVASDATSRLRREDDGIGDPAGALSPPLTASTQETTDQDWSARTRLHQMQRRGIQFRCVRCQHVASSSTLKQQRRGQMRYLAVGRAEVFSVVGNPLPTSLAAGVDTTVIALWLGHESVATTQIYIHADLAIKEKALARTAPLDARAGRYQPPDALVAFLESL